ncbi:mitochondrial ATPase expression-domain-containing protein [Aspergillus varians]
MRVTLRLCEGLASHIVCPPCRPLSRRRSHQLPPIASASPQFSRWFTTRGSLAAWKWNTTKTPKPKVGNPQLEADPNSVHESPGLDTVPLNRDSERLADLKSEFYSILETGQPDQVMAVLLNYDCSELVATMPQSVFVEALHLLSPAYFVEPYKEIYRPLHPFSVEIKRYKSQQSIFDDFVRNLSAIVRVRRSAGYTLGLAEYTHLLDCARSLGDALMADYIWHSMKRDGVAPDVQCYNHYMEVKVWDLAYTNREKYHLRMTPFAYRKRRFADIGWEGYGTGPRSVRKEVRGIFNEMIEAGNEGDEASIVSLLMASARVGDHGAMKDILKTTWNIDVNSLGMGSLDNVTEYARTSPFYPSSRLLQAVAHAFSTNNDIPTALRIIEHVSMAYDIEVPHTVWAELFEWSFVLSRRRYGPDAEKKSIGFVTSQYFENLFQTMTQGPFNVQPTVEMHHKLAKTAWVFRRLKDFVHHMRAAYKIMDETRQKKIAARKIVESYLRYPRIDDTQMDPQILRSRGFADAVHAYDVLRLQVMQQTIIMERLARLLIFRDAWTGSNHIAWECRLLPQILEEWRDFIPESFFYHTQSGRVRIHGITAYGDAQLTTHRGIQVRRPSLNDDFTLDPASDELEDSFIWARYRKDMFYLDLQSPLLIRLFEPIHFEYNEEEEGEAWEELEKDPQINDEIYGEVEGDFARPRGLGEPPAWAMRVYESRDRKNAALIKTFGPFPDPDEGKEAESTAPASDYPA